MLRVILIDSVTQEISEQNMEGEMLEVLYKLIGCDMVERAHTINNTNEIYVDEEGLFKGHTTAFGFKGAHQQFFVGKGVVVGVDHAAGDLASTTMTVAEVSKNVAFYCKP